MTADMGLSDLSYAETSAPPVTVLVEVRWLKNEPNCNQVTLEDMQRLAACIETGDAAVNVPIADDPAALRQPGIRLALEVAHAKGRAAVVTALAAVTPIDSPDPNRRFYEPDEVTEEFRNAGFTAGSTAYVTSDVLAHLPSPESRGVQRAPEFVEAPCELGPAGESVTTHAIRVLAPLHTLVTPTHEPEYDPLAVLETVFADGSTQGDDTRGKFIAALSVAMKPLLRVGRSGDQIARTLQQQRVPLQPEAAVFFHPFIVIDAIAQSMVGRADVFVEQTPPIGSVTRDYLCQGHMLLIEGAYYPAIDFAVGPPERWTGSRITCTSLSFVNDRGMQSSMARTLITKPMFIVRDAEEVYRYSEADFQTRPFHRFRWQETYAHFSETRDQLKATDFVYDPDDWAPDPLVIRKDEHIIEKNPRLLDPGASALVDVDLTRKPPTFMTLAPGFRKADDSDAVVQDSGIVLGGEELPLETHAADSGRLQTLGIGHVGALRR